MTSISEIFGTSTQVSTQTSESSDSSAIMGKEDFLTLLVAQLKNQDPMNPDDPTEFTAQLAQFSSLEQLFNINESMESLTSAQKQSDRFSTMNLIGKTVAYQDSDFSIAEDGTATIGYSLDGAAAKVSLAIVDENGTTVATLYPTEMTKGNHFVEWDGLDTNDEHVPAGTYTISIQATAAEGEESIAISPLVQSEVTSVDFNSETDDAILCTLTGAEITSDSILAVYDASSTKSEESSGDEESSTE